MKVIYNVRMKCWVSFWDGVDEYAFECADIQEVASKVISTLEQYPKLKNKLTPAVKYTVDYVEGQGFHVNALGKVNMTTSFRESLVNSIDKQFKKADNHIINGIQEPYAKVEYDSNLNVCDIGSLIKIIVTCSVKEDE